MNDKVVTVQDLKRVIAVVQELARQICKHQNGYDIIPTGDAISQEPYTHRVCSVCGEILD